MTYLKRSNHAAKRHWAMTSAIVALLALLFSINQIFPSFYERLLSPFTSFIWKSESSLFSWLGSMGELARSKASLIAENESLRSELSAREGATILLDSTQRENEELKALLGRKGAKNDVVGVVISRPPASPYDTFVIDIGSADGVKVGAKVYAGGSVLIGDIAEVFGKTSKVSLFSAPGRAVQVLLGPSHKEVDAVGRGGGNFTAKVPVGVAVEKGDTLELSQLRNHVFGVVQDIVADSTDSLQTIMFKAPVNLSELRLVQVEK